MAKLSFKSKSSNSSTSNKMTIKENFHSLQTKKYKKILIASIILNIIVILTTIMRGI